MTVGLLIFGTSVCSNFVATQSVPKSTVVPPARTHDPFQGYRKTQNYTATGKLVSHLKQQGWIFAQSRNIRVDYRGWTVTRGRATVYRK